MAIPRDPDGLSLLELGTEFDCPICFQRSVAVLHEVSLWCESCGAHLLDFDPTDHDRVQLDEEGRMSGRGPPSRRGRIEGSVMGLIPTSVLGSSRWRRLRSIDRSGRGTPTRSKLRAMEEIRRLAATPDHEAMALDLLDIGWPGHDVVSPNQSAKDKPMWQPAHPNGIASSAAVCLHLTARDMGFDSQFGEWVSRCMPEVKNAKSYGFRCLKRMRKILGEDRARRQSVDSQANAILSRANLGATIYGAIAGRIWEEWQMLSAIGLNAANHPRPMLAALCETIAEREGLPVIPSLIESRFNVPRSYKSWKHLC